MGGLRASATGPTPAWFPSGCTSRKVLGARKKAKGLVSRCWSSDTAETAAAAPRQSGAAAEIKAKPER